MPLKGPSVPRQWYRPCQYSDEPLQQTEIERVEYNFLFRKRRESPSLFSINGRNFFNSRRSETFDSNTGETSASFSLSGNVHCWTISIASLVTALKEKSEVNLRICVGTSPLVFLVISKRFISSQTSADSKGQNSEVSLSLATCLILTIFDVI